MCPQYRHVTIEHVFFSRTASRHIDFHTDFRKSLHSGMSSAAIHFPTNMFQPIHSKHCANKRAEFGGACTLSWSRHENKHCKWNQLRCDKRTSLILILLRSCSVHRMSKRLLLALPCTTKKEVLLLSNWTVKQRVPTLKTNLDQTGDQLKKRLDSQRQSQHPACKAVDPSSTTFVQTPEDSGQLLAPSVQLATWVTLAEFRDPSSFYHRWQLHCWSPPVDI